MLAALPLNKLTGNTITDPDILMEELKTLGIAENTVFIAMADNGPMTEAPGAVGTTQLRELNIKLKDKPKA